MRWRLESVDAPGSPSERAVEDLLSARERALLRPLKFPRRRRKWLAGRLAAKALLLEDLHAAGTDVPASALSILNETSGAPYAEIEGSGRWPGSLSISHRGGFGLAAVAGDGVAVGADVETVEPRDAALVRQFFTEAEGASVERASGSRDLQVARIWSAKEAVLKALGLGLRLDTRQIEVSGEESPMVDGWRAVAVSLCREAAEAAGPRPLRLYQRDLGEFVITIAVLGWSSGRLCAAEIPSEIVLPAR